MFPIRDHNPSLRTPFVTYVLMGLNIAIFAYTATLGEQSRALAQVYYDYAMIPARVSMGEGWGGMLTSMFLHAGFMHIAGNMLFLWIFGDNLEEELGHVGFLLFYLGSGLLAALAQLLADPLSPVPTVGASGAIAGVMGGYLLMFPKAKVDVLVILVVFIRILPIPAWVMLGLWFVIQLFGGVGSDPGDGGGIAYWAHAGGFVAGMVLLVPLWLRRGGPAYWSRTEGHPPHPEADWSPSRVPVVRRGRSPRPPERKGPWT